MTVARLTTLALLFCASNAHAADWPAFRGPDGTGASADANPPTKWTAKDGVKWTTPLPGAGSSSPIVVGDRVFVTYFTGEGEKLVRHLACLDRETGKVRWTADVKSVAAEDPYRGYLRSEHGYASHTPVSDGESVFVFFGKSGVLAFDLAGKQLWQTSVGTQSDIRGWGSAASPVLHGKLVIVNAASESRAVVALDKATGKVVWKETSAKLSLSFGSPALVKAADRTDLVVAMPTTVWGLDPDTGKSRWTAAIRPDGNISPAVVAGNGVAYVYGGYTTNGSAAIKAGGSGDVKPLWASKATSYVPTPALVGDRLYCVTDTGMAQCVNAADGKAIYEERLPIKAGGGKGSKPVYASAVVADGRVYAVTRRGGTFVYKAGDTFDASDVIANPPLDDTDFNATPALAGKQLFLRSNKAVYCIE